MKHTQIIDITAEFKDKWSGFVNPKLNTLQICQTNSEVLLKYALSGLDGDTIIKEEKMDFITLDNGPLFSNKNTIQANSVEFFKLKSIDIIHCFDYLFDEEMIDFIIDYTSQGITDDQILFDDTSDLTKQH